MPYHQGIGGFVGIFLLAGISPSRAFSCLRTLSQSTDFGRIFHEGVTFHQTFTSFIFDIFSQRNYSFAIFRFPDFRMKIEAVVTTWLTTFFCSTLSIPELLSVFVLYLVHGMKVLLCLCLVILESTLISSGANMRLVDEMTQERFYKELKSEFVHDLYNTQRRFVVTS